MENQIYNNQEFLEAGARYINGLTKTVASTQTYIKIAYISKSTYFTHATAFVFVNNQQNDTAKTAFVKFQKRGGQTTYCYVYNNEGFAITDFFTIDDGTNINLWVACGTDPISNVYCSVKVLDRYDRNVIFLFNGSLTNGNILQTIPSGTIVPASGGVGNFIPLANNTNSVSDPTSAQDAATKNYVDTTTVGLSGDVMTGPLILSGNPTVDQQAATKLYVDGSWTAATSVRTINYRWINGSNIDTGNDWKVGTLNSADPSVTFQYIYKGKFVFCQFYTTDVNNDVPGTGPSVQVGRGFKYSPTGGVGAYQFYGTLPFTIVGSLIIPVVYAAEGANSVRGSNFINGLLYLSGNDFIFARNLQNATITSGLGSQWNDQFISSGMGVWWAGNFTAITV